MKGIICWKPIDTYQLFHLIIQFLGWCIAVGSLVLLSQQVNNFTNQTERQTQAIELQTKAVKLQTDALNIEVSRALAQVWTPIDEAFIRRSDLRKFFYESAKPVPGTEKYAAALAVAELMLDTFDVFFQRNDHDGPSFPGPGPIRRVTSENFMRDMFSRSPILCERLEQAKTWYSENLYSFAKPTCATWSKARATQTKHVGKT